jgi:hypothetical protein
MLLIYRVLTLSDSNSSLNFFSLGDRNPKEADNINQSFSESYTGSQWKGCISEVFWTGSQRTWEVKLIAKKEGPQSCRVNCCMRSQHFCTKLSIPCFSIGVCARHKSLLMLIPLICIWVTRDSAECGECIDRPPIHCLVRLSSGGGRSDALEVASVTVIREGLQCYLWDLLLPLREVLASAIASCPIIVRLHLFQLAAGVNTTDSTTRAWPFSQPHLPSLQAQCECSAAHRLF